MTPSTSAIGLATAGRCKVVVIRAKQLIRDCAFCTLRCSSNCVEDVADGISSVNHWRHTSHIFRKGDVFNILRDNLLFASYAFVVYAVVSFQGQDDD
jgi:hypothetical protein